MLLPLLRRYCTPEQASAWPVFAALYLVIFAFFVLLVGMSRPHALKSEALVDSVRQALQPSPKPAADDALVAGRSALAELGGDLQAVLRIARIQRVGRGEELRLSIRESDLFDGDGLEPAERIFPVIDRIVTALGTPPAGLRLTMRLTLPLPSQHSPAAIAAEGGDVEPLPRAARRAAAFATVLIDRGASPQAITAGVATGPDLAALVFRFQRTGGAATSGANAS